MTQQKPRSAKPVILVFTGTYLPGYRAGGPIRSIANLVEALSDDFEFRIIAVNHDFGETTPYPGIIPDVWTKVGKAQVMYLSRRGQSLLRLWELIRHTSYDAIYLNSFFARRFSMFPFALWRLGLINRAPLVLAPRGEFSSGALGLKHLRKLIFLRLSRLTNWYGGPRLIWQASSEFEEKDIQRVWGKASISHASAPTRESSHPEPKPKNRNIRNAPDIPTRSFIPVEERVKKPGSLALVFIGRINRMKNLDFALRALVGLRGDVALDIFGPEEDSAYWAECGSFIKQLESNIVATYRGQIPHDEVLLELSRHDILFLPTRGENYGHVISEALSAGCPVIISDQTPWRNLQGLGVGWDLPLDEIEAFREALQQCVDMDSEEYGAFSSRAQSFGLARGSDEEVVNMNRQLFQSALKMVDQV